MTVFKNWDKKEREIERGSHKEHVISEHDRENTLDEIGLGNRFDAKYENMRFPTLEKQYVHKIDYLVDRIRTMSELQARQEEEIRGLREGYKRAHLEDLFEQSSVNRKGLESICGTDLNDMGEVSLDGLLKEYVDPEQNSQELVRFIRDN